MSSESPNTIFSAFIISESVFSQSCSSYTAVSNFGHGDERPERENSKDCLDSKPYKEEVCSYGGGGRPGFLIC